jgi:carbon monoxide dehydrogenase subunit G
MAVRIEKTFQVKQALERVWPLLKDPRAVANLVPGAKITESVDEKTFRGAISVKVGPTVTDYKGKLRVERLDEQNHEIELVGKGQDARGKGSASMKMTGKLTASPDGGTEVKTVSEINVIGILAQLGGRMIHDVSDVMFVEFVKRFQERLEQPDTAVAAETASAEPVNAVRVVSSALGRSVRRVFGGADESGENS